VKPLTHKEITKLSKDRAKRFWPLPIIVIVAGIMLTFLNIPADFKMPVNAVEIDPRVVLWNSRQIDIFGQIVILLAGVFGIVLLFKETRKK